MREREQAGSQRAKQVGESHSEQTSAQAQAHNQVIEQSSMSDHRTSKCAGEIAKRERARTSRQRAKQVGESQSERERTSKQANKRTIK